LRQAGLFCLTEHTGSTDNVRHMREAIRQHFPQIGFDPKRVGVHVINHGFRFHILDVIGQNGLALAISVLRAAGSGAA